MSIQRDSGISGAAESTIGVMLPSTPLHFLLFGATEEACKFTALLMTSGNISEEPIATRNEDALDRLRGDEIR